MRAWSWVVVAVSGFGVMLGAYSTRPQPLAGSPFAHGFLFIGPEPAKDVRPPGRVVPTRIRLLPADDRAEGLLKVMERAMPDKAQRLRWQLRRKLIALPLSEAGIDAGSLQAGRLPEAGRDEALAGAGSTRHDRVVAGDRTLSVVGVLKAVVSLPSDCYLVPSSESARYLVPPGDPSVHAGTVVGLTPEQFRDRELLRRLEAALPSPTYTMLMPLGRLGPGTYYFYLAGQAALLIGGSGALIGLYHWLASRVRRPWLAAPLREMDRRPRLVWGVHLAYFGLVMAASVLIYRLPEVQAVLLSLVRDEIGSSQGPLGIAGKAYGSGSIPLAAVVTFLINLLLGTLVSITLPSIIVPGSGALLAALRSVSWGLLLAPTFVLNAFAMLPHSGTILLEGEGYILATFFGLLVPIYLVRSSPAEVPDSMAVPDSEVAASEPVPPSRAETILSRFGRAALLNIQASVLVAVVLAVAACWEATEVILMMR